MARGGEFETAAQQTRDHAARDGKRNCEGALRAGRRIARRHQAIQSERATGLRNADAFRCRLSVLGSLEKPRRLFPVLKCSDSARSEEHTSELQSHSDL